VLLTEYYLVVQTKEGGMGRTCGMYGEKSTYRVVVSKSEGKKPLGRSRHSWEDNIKMGLKRNKNDVHGLD
jgi:hypothetical protein